MTDRDLWLSAWIELTLTTDSYPTWKKKGFPSSSHWAKAKTKGDQIGTTEPVPPPVTLPPRIASSVGPTVYCSPSGSDSTGTGTITSPWKTLGRGWASMPAGATLLLRSGAYTDRCDPSSAWGGTATAVKTIASYPGEVAVYQRFIRIDPAKPVSYVRFQEIEFYGALTLPGEDSIVYGRSGSHIEFLRCNIHGQIGGSAMVVEQPCVDWQWWDCLIPHNGRKSTNLDHGLYLEGQRFVVGRCAVYGNSAYGIQLWPTATDCLIYACMIVDNGKESPAATIGTPEYTGGIVVAGNAPGAVHGNQIVGNIIGGNTGYALKTNSAVTAADGNVAIGNTMVGNTNGPTSFYNPGAIPIS